MALVLLAAGLLVGRPAEAQVATTWTGAAGDGRYSNPANWSGGVAPINSSTTLFNVVVPFISGKSTLTLDSDAPSDITVNDFTLANGVTFNVNPNRRFIVDDDGLISGQVNVTGGRSQFDGGWALQTPGNTARFAVAQSGTAVVRSAAYLTTGLGSAGYAYTPLAASGSGSVLDASSIQSWSAGFNDGWYGVTLQQVTASNQGRVNLSGLTTLTTPVNSEDRVDFIVSGGGQIDLANLTTVNGAGAIRFEVNDAASMTVPKLTAVSRMIADVRAGGTLSLPEMTTASNFSMSLGDNATFAAPKLVNLQYSGLSLTTGRTFTTGALTNINNTWIGVSGGKVWGTSTGELAAQTYSTTGLSAASANYGVLSASGSGSVLDASSIQSWSAGFNDGWYGVTLQQVTASNQGRVNLSGLTTLTTPVNSEDRVDFIVSGGGQIDLSNLTTVNGAGAIRFEVNDAASMTVPKLTAVSRMIADVRAGGTLSLPEMTTASNFSMSLGDNATFTAPKLVNLQSSVLSLAPGRTFTTGALTNINNTRVDVSGGKVWGTSTGELAAQTFSTTGLNGTYDSWEVFTVSGSGSVLDLSSMQSWNGGFSTGWGGVNFHRVTASSGGRIDLSGLTTLTTPVSSEDRVDFVVSSGGQIDLSSLRSISGAGQARFTIGTGGTIAMGDLVAAGNTRIELQDMSSRLTVAGNLFLGPSAALATVPLSRVEIGDSFLYTTTAEASIEVSQAIVQMRGIGLHYLEAGGVDKGLPTFFGPDPVANFGIGQLVVGTGTGSTTLAIIDAINNGNRTATMQEALYLYGIGGTDGVVINPGSTLLLNDAVSVYAYMDSKWVRLNDLTFGTTAPVRFSGGFIQQVPEPTTVLLLAAAAAPWALRQMARHRARRRAAQTADKA